MEKNRNWFIILPFLIILIIASLSKTVDTSTKPDKLHVVALGDSITYGTGDPLKKGYIVRFKEDYKRYKSSYILLKNYGIPKFKTTDILTQLKEHKIQNSVQSSDYIILNIGTNDFRKSADYTFESIQENEITEGKLKFQKNLDLIFKQLRRVNPSSPIFVMGLYNPYTEYQNEDELHSLIADWNKVITIVSSKYNNVTFVPTIDLFYGELKKEYYSDSLHLNPKGYELMANRLLTYVRTYDENNNKP
ncbi:GDSL-type esterase/lipase family protein [Litchfieldia alkalitelluris]|uniref:GDSL-type esterase/lipase family protein n=1 Tax=Litchfieldia alkalitelluris TaxID=304268 RepID=UPI000998A5E4|nr:GDSL-type esterase/lipase family protein [Litchfieldia alkalitelluris]